MVERLWLEVTELIVFKSLPLSLMWSFSQLSLICFMIRDLNALDWGIGNPPDTISQSIKTNGRDVI